MQEEKKVIDVNKLFNLSAFTHEFRKAVPGSLKLVERKTPLESIPTIRLVPRKS